MLIFQHVYTVHPNIFEELSYKKEHPVLTAHPDFSGQISFQISVILIL